MDIIHKMVVPEGNFPGNTYYPLLIYKQVFSDVIEPEDIQTQLKQNNWENAWIDSVYDFHHYHSNTHEVLVIISGNGEIQFGGENGQIFTVQTGDVIIIPAGVAHKSLKLSHNFRCMGAYPFHIAYDMNYGKIEEYSDALKTIKQVGLPKKDPIFGEKGTLFNYWK